MNKDDFNNWLARKVQFQSKLTMGAVAAMIGIGLIAFTVQGGLLFFALMAGFNLTFAIVGNIALFGGMGCFTWWTAPKTLKDEEYEVNVDGKMITVPIAPSLSSAWTYAMGSRESSLSIPERIFALFMLVPRMFWTAWYLVQRSKDVKDIEVRECGAILRFVLKRAERVNAIEIAEKRPQTDLPRTLRQVSLIDGIVFLSRGELGLTLANRFKDDLEKGTGSGAKPQATSDGPAFD